MQRLEDVDHVRDAAALQSNDPGAFADLDGPLLLELELTAESLEQAERSFGQLVERVEDATSAGLIEADDPVDVAQQIWNALHGGVSLEIAGVTFSSDPERTFASMIDTLLVGLTP